MYSIQTNKSDFPKNTGKKYKVILNAGGGIFGYVITNFMSYLDFDLYDKVDVVAGTSIGGILTLAYCCTTDYEWINYLFEKNAPKIFSDNNPLYAIRGPKFNGIELEKMLKTIYGDNTLKDINRIAGKSLHTIIPTLDYTLTQPRIFENINLRPEQENVSLVDIGLSTASAPTYFPVKEYLWSMQDYDLKKCSVNEQILLLTQRMIEYRSAMEKQLKHNFSEKSVIMDGGVIENIPVVTTYTTLQAELGVEPKDIDMLVIGTGDDTKCNFETYEDVNKWSILEWALKFIVPYVTESNELMSAYWGAQMGFNSFTFFNPVETTGALDDCSIMPGLKASCKAKKSEFLDTINEFLER